MKTILLSSITLLAALSLQAQNKNVTDVSKTTVTTVKDSDGEKTYLKTQEVKEVQNIEFQNADSKALNKDLKETPVEVISKTQVINPDGSTRTVDIDRSSYYTSNGKTYQLRLDPAGYVITTQDNKRLGLLRATTTNSYIYRGKNQTSIGYFDTNGNLVVETYDDKSDKVSVETYVRSPK
ncbi:MAG: hypothetical protein JNM71_13800 [Flavobacterium lindanitolerans]|jgi:hypothetical protein|uniref:hypothetical protein n=1 Tax=Flavobacterium TaxID=237 RepID=UPI0006FFF6F3|nr:MULTISPECIES: hypothetical protein [Flavobacterium]MBU7569834.1 hypothetical protein [Flavobacterium sp.]PZO27502.1 MAG: hypothetical protein DCE86_13110 [Flavobacteriaceae bacterium]PZQ90189.1 MAG: hypothetical protein DI548_03255 [Flavobacterium johnsoniae]KQS47709.1 hypothetical protein ASG38_09730 [Flavobacterium sp. Leaf359]MBL7869085.1 hypothetical protein [Flavobacterium lindanitolerans]